MLKRILAFILALVLCCSLIACDAKDGKDKDTGKDSGKETGSKTPEEITEKFVRAMLTGDLDGFLADVPDFVYDFMANMPGVEFEPGGDKVEAVRKYFEKVMAAEPEDVAAEVTVETKRSDNETKEDYLEIVNKYYIPEGVLTEEQLDEFEDVVYVAFNYTAKYEDGSEKSTTDWEAAMPCLKIDGKWYVDIIYLFMVPVQSAPTPERVPV